MNPTNVPRAAEAQAAFFNFARCLHNVRIQMTPPVFQRYQDCTLSEEYRQVLRSMGFTVTQEMRKDGWTQVPNGNRVRVKWGA